MILLTLAWGSLGVAILLGAALAVRRHERAARLAKLRAEWGRARDVDRDMKAIAAYYPGRAIPEPAGCGINDRTWDDLNMDDAFSVLDRTESVVGQQVLYARLRTVPVADHLAAFEALVTTGKTLRFRRGISTISSKWVSFDPPVPCRTDCRA